MQLTFKELVAQLSEIDTREQRIRFLANVIFDAQDSVISKSNRIPLFIGQVEIISRTVKLIDIKSIYGDEIREYPFTKIHVPFTVSIYTNPRPSENQKFALFTIEPLKDLRSANELTLLTSSEYHVIPEASYYAAVSFIIKNPALFTDIITKDERKGLSLSISGIDEQLTGQKDTLVQDIQTLIDQKSHIEKELETISKNEQAAKESYSSQQGKLADLNKRITALRQRYISLFPDCYDKEYLSWSHMSVSSPNTLATIKSRLFYKYDDNKIIAFLMALTTSQIIALCGDPGVGKTTFAEHMAKALGAKFHRIEVQNNWTDRSDILGFFNPTNGSYQSTPFLDALIEARDDEEENGTDARLHIICLDEMNLARVEYYFATFLSLLQQSPEQRTILVLPWEARYRHAGSVDPSKADDKLMRYQHIYIPSNVRFVGTMNMDDTTQHLSPKVIDRCIFIEFSKIDTSGKNTEYCMSHAYFPVSDFMEVWVPDDVPEIEHALDQISVDPQKEESGFIAGKRLRKYAKCMWPIYHQMMPEKTIEDYIDLILCSKVLPAITLLSETSKLLPNHTITEKRVEAGQRRGETLHPYDKDSWSYWE